MQLLTVLIISISLSFIGCNAVSDMKDIAGKHLLLQNVLKEKYGLKSKVGWKMENGILTGVTITFDAEEVRNRKVFELETAAKEAIDSSFKSKPRVINLLITL